MSAQKKLEIIRSVEGSGLPVQAALARVEVPPSTYYRWRRKFRLGGTNGLQDHSPYPGRVWNQLLPEERERILELAMLYPEWSPRELATMTEQGFCTVTELARFLGKPYRTVKAVYKLNRLCERAKCAIRRVTRNLSAQRLLSPHQLAHVRVERLAAEQMRSVKRLLNLS